MKPSDLITATHPLLADRVRLAIMASLAAAEEPLDFNGLLQSLELTKGNLASHVRKLEDAGLLAVHKAFVGKKTHTTYSCTARGRREVQNYLEKIESLLRSVR